MMVVAGAWLHLVTLAFFSFSLSGWKSWWEGFYDLTLLLHGGLLAGSETDWSSSCRFFALSSFFSPGDSWVWRGFSLPFLLLLLWIFSGG